MKHAFESAAPEALGIPSGALERFLKALMDNEIPMHSVLLMRHGKIALEAYYAPYDRETKHRMYSVTKSFTSLAIGLLIEEGRLSLGDRICKFFPELLPPEGVHPYIEGLTIRDMLRMSTAHQRTTYTFAGQDNYTRTFFTTPPDHMPGACFCYDTSSSHTLAALVEKLSGMDLVGYLREKALGAVGFSPDAYCVRDPVGVSMGGAGLVCTPYDLLRVASVVMNGGRFKGRQLLPEAYIREAVSKQIDSYLANDDNSFDQMQGYGYQIWRCSHNGFYFCGIGGQLAVCLPERDLILVTTADTMGRKGGVQIILDTFWAQVYPALADTPLPPDARAHASLLRAAGNLKLFHMPGERTSPLGDRISGRAYALDKNDMGIMKISLTLNGDGGVLRYDDREGSHAIPFGIGGNVVASCLAPQVPCAVSGAFRSPQTFLIRVELMGEHAGNNLLELSFVGDTVTLRAHKYADAMFPGMEGIASGRAV